MKPVDVITGESPIILAMPHSGLHVPEPIYARLNHIGRELADTDWHIDALYTGLIPNVTMVRANFHRYVIDPNRSPSDESFYPGQNTTGLCPLTDFDGAEIYKMSQAPEPDEIEVRRLTYHSPYHEALSAEITRIKSLHGIALLYDCHSIRSHVPYLFEGALPDFNIGTNSGKSCAPELQKTVSDICNQAKAYSSVENGRFKGGWTARHYGKPDTGVHAIQMELSQTNYMQESAPWIYRKSAAEKLRSVLKHILQSLETQILKGQIS
ncbi:MAG: N-formylglutamate deformylase [Maricaulaceae bacterium]